MNTNTLDHPNKLKSHNDMYPYEDVVDAARVIDSDGHQEAGTQSTAQAGQRLEASSNYNLAQLAASARHPLYSETQEDDDLLAVELAAPASHFPAAHPAATPPVQLQRAWLDVVEGDTPDIENALAAKPRPAPASSRGSSWPVLLQELHFSETADDETLLAQALGTSASAPTLPDNASPRPLVFPGTAEDDALMAEALGVAEPDAGVSAAIHSQGPQPYSSNEAADDDHLMAEALGALAPLKPVSAITPACHQQPTASNEGVGNDMLEEYLNDLEQGPPPPQVWSPPHPRPRGMEPDGGGGPYHPDDFEPVVPGPTARVVELDKGNDLAAQLHPPRTLPSGTDAFSSLEADGPAPKRQRVGVPADIAAELDRREALLSAAAAAKKRERERAEYVARLLGPDTSSRGLTAGNRQQDRRSSSAKGSHVFGAGLDGPPAAGRPRKLASNIEGAYVSVTTASGERVYCRLRTPPPSPSGNAPATVFPAACREEGAACGSGLLARPVAEMLCRIDDARVQHALGESARAALLQQQRDAVPRGPPRPEREAAHGALSGAGTAVNGTVAVHAEQLWVDKYSPRTFGKLLSDDATNRDVAKWVKSWDACVFGRGGAAASSGGAAERGGGATLSCAVAAAMRGREKDVRPEQKLILICGPPGLGKTTLAHVVAEHCGYTPVEINASDDRTASTLSTRIQDAVQMQPVMGKRRPNCVIIDEIDGATGGNEGHSAVQAVLRISQAGVRGGALGPDKGAQGEAAAAGGKVRRRRLAARPLHRPIICICNDLYAPALRPLRESARVFHFRLPPPDRLVDRLKSICDVEGVKADKQALRLLAERSDCDIRASLNTLQFLCKRTRHVRLAEVEGLGIGVKDMTKSAFGLWDELLSAHNPRRRSHRQYRDEADRQRGLMETLQGFGEYELVLAGLHENILRQPYLDVSLAKTSKLCDSFAAADTFLRNVRRHQDYSLGAYVPACLMQVQGVVTATERPSVSWPTTGSEASQRQAAHAETLRTWAGRMSPRVLQTSRGHARALDVLPALKRVLCPSLRALAPKLLSPAESRTLAATVGVMLDYGLNYSFDEEPATPSPGQRPWQVPRKDVALFRPAPLTPAVDCLHTFAGMAPLRPAAAQKAVPLAVRQMVAQHVNLEAIRRADQHRREQELELHARDGGDTARPPASTDGAGTVEADEEGATPRAVAAGVLMRSITKFGIHKGVPSNEKAAPAAVGPGPRTGAWRPETSAAGVAKSVVAPKAVARGGTWLDTFKLAGVKRRAAGLTASSAAAHAAKTETAAAMAAAGGSTVPGHAGAPGDTSSSPACGDSAAKAVFPVLYRYNEGYTNAVKRPLAMRELL